MNYLVLLCFSFISLQLWGADSNLREDGYDDALYVDSMLAREEKKEKMGFSLADRRIRLKHLCNCYKKQIAVKRRGFEGAAVPFEVEQQLAVLQRRLVQLQKRLSCLREKK